MESLVSVIMPAYNAAQHIAESIASVQAQTYRNWELLVIDDGSIDDTAAIVKHHSAHDSRIKYVYQKNAKQSRARNNGIARAVGEYIAFLDSDDIWFSDKLYLQMQAFNDNNVDLIFSEAVTFENKFRESFDKQTMGSGRGTYCGTQGLTIFLDKNQIPTLTVVVKKVSLSKVANFTESEKFPNAEDYHLWLKLLLEGCSFYGMSDILGAYRVHSASTSDSDRWCTKYVVEAKANLAQVYPCQYDLIQSSLIVSIKDNLAELERGNDVTFYQQIKRGLSLSKKSVFIPVISVLSLLNLRKLALRVGYFTLNYL